MKKIGKIAIVTSGVLLAIGCAYASDEPVTPNAPSNVVVAHDTPNVSFTVGAGADAYNLQYEAGGEWWPYWDPTDYPQATPGQRITLNVNNGNPQGAGVTDGTYCIEDINTNGYADSACVPFTINTSLGAPTNVTYNTTQKTIDFTTGAGTVRWNLYYNNNGQLELHAYGNTTANQNIATALTNGPGLYALSDNDSQGNESNKVAILVEPLGTLNGLTAAASSLPAGVNLSWTPVDASLDTVTTPNYLIEKSTDGSTWTMLGSTRNASYFDNNVAPNTTYYYRVQATIDNDNTPWSSSVNALVPNYPMPTAPTAVHLTALADSTAEVQWTPGKNNAYDKVSFQEYGGNAVTTTVNNAMNKQIFSELLPGDADALQIEACNGDECTYPAPNPGLMFTTYQYQQPEPPINFQAHFAQIESKNNPGQYQSALVATWTRNKYDPSCTQGAGGSNPAYELQVLNPAISTTQFQNMIPDAIAATANNGCEAIVKQMQYQQDIGSGETNQYTVREMVSGPYDGTTYQAGTLSGAPATPVDLTSPYIPPKPPVDFQVTVPQLNQPNKLQLSWQPGAYDLGYQITRYQNGHATILDSNYAGLSYVDTLASPPTASNPVSYSIQGVDGPLLSNPTNGGPKYQATVTPASINLFDNGNNAGYQIFANGKSAVAVNVNLCDASGNLITYSEDPTDYNNIQFYLNEADNSGQTVNLPIDDTPVSANQSGTGFQPYQPISPNQAPPLNCKGVGKTYYLTSSQAGSYEMLAAVEVSTGQGYQSLQSNSEGYYQLTALPPPDMNVNSTTNFTSLTNGNYYEGSEDIGTPVGYEGYLNFSNKASSNNLVFTATNSDFANSGTQVAILDDIATNASAVNFVPKNTQTDQNVGTTLQDYSNGSMSNNFGVNLSYDWTQLPEEGNLSANLTDQYGDSFSYLMPYHDFYNKIQTVNINGQNVKAFFVPSFWEHVNKDTAILVDFYFPNNTLPQGFEYRDGAIWHDIPAGGYTDTSTDDPDLSIENGGNWSTTYDDTLGNQVGATDEDNADIEVGSFDSSTTGYLDGSFCEDYWIGVAPYYTTGSTSTFKYDCR